jgi:hypothetical protein
LCQRWTLEDETALRELSEKGFHLRKVATEASSLGKQHQEEGNFSKSGSAANACFRFM